jgi:hypothetical protein
LQDPYPNAFIRCKDGSVLYLKKSGYLLWVKLFLIISIIFFAIAVVVP